MKMYTKIVPSVLFRSRELASSYTETIKDCCIQIPSASDINGMQAMPAGIKEDQRERLTHMTQRIKDFKLNNPSLPLVDTDQVTLPHEWRALFLAMRENKKQVLKHLKNLAETDELMHAILAVHSFDYISELIQDCMLAQSVESLDLGSDIVVTAGTFEILIKDIATTLFNPAKVLFSFGLPTHHAFSNEGSGFCVLNKTEILIKYLAIKNSSMKYIIIGTDINRDNGLSWDLFNSGFNLDICHIDIFDSRVYPKQDHKCIAEEFENNGRVITRGIKCWQKEALRYFAADLSLISRSIKSDIHPALVFVLSLLENEIKNVYSNNQKLVLILPTGWDSHEDETAPCGKFVYGRFMNKIESHETRFSTQDLVQFYNKLFELYYEHMEVIEKIYWGLEGGYNRAMYEKQIDLLMERILDKLVLHHFKEETLPPRSTEL